MLRIAFAFSATLAMIACSTSQAHAAQCGSSSAGFAAWKQEFSIATLAYDCRRSEYFTEHLYAALQLIDRGALSPAQRGSMHGEVGQTQFMPKAILAYGTGNLENSANALSSTANFLKAHGWRAGAGYQPGEPNFAAIQAWNAAGVYQKAIALMGRQIDGGGE